MDYIRKQPREKIQEQQEQPDQSSKPSIRKKRQPGGRPFPPGVSGNPRGRRKGSLNKITLAIFSATGKLRKKKEPSNQPTLAQNDSPQLIMLNKNIPFEVWGQFYIQQGRKFRKDSLTEMNPGDPPIEQPERLTTRKPRMVITWKGKEYYIQDGWLFDRRTWEAVDYPFVSP